MHSQEHSPQRARIGRSFATLMLVALAACSPPPEEVSVSSRSIIVSDAEFACLREAIYFEAGGLAQGSAGGQAVANVIINRSTDPRFPGTICGVISDGCQFSYRCDARSEKFVEPRKLALADEAARLALLNHGTDFTKGALFFHAAWMRPGWFATLDRTGLFGGNIFYRPHRSTRG